MGQDSTFGIDPLSIGMDIRLARAFAACCGVNLAFAALGVCGFFSRKGGFSSRKGGFFSRTGGFFSRKLETPGFQNGTANEYFWR
jgi:hypothetical protein